jgi:TonB-dependent starch-binding outer membrane protein SusC
MASWRGVNGVEGTDHLGNAFANVRIDNNVTTEQFFNIRKDVAYGYWNGPGTSNTTPRPVRRGVFLLVMVHKAIIFLHLPAFWKTHHISG